MDKINRIELNGKVYQLVADDKDVVVELTSLGDGSNDIIFMGVIPVTDEDKPLTYDYLKNLMETDNENNKAFKPTTEDLTLRYNWKAEVVDGKAICRKFFLLLPENHPRFYGIKSSCQFFRAGDDDFKEIEIEFPTGKKKFTLFKFWNELVRMSQPLTYQW